MFGRDEKGITMSILSRLFGSGSKDTSGNLGYKLYIGMPFADIVSLLGEPSGVNLGTEMFEAGPRGKVVVSDEICARLSHTQYCMWKCPEGMYLLVIEDGKLARIHRKP